MTRFARRMVLLLAMLAPAAGAAEVEGVRLPETTRIGGGPELVLNGAGVRTRFFVKVYVGALYLQERIASPEVVLENRGQKRVHIHMLRALGSDQLFRALHDGLRDNLSDAQIEHLAPRLKQLEAMFDIGRALEKGDQIRLDVLPGKGTRVLVNAESRGTLPGDDIGRALLRVWLGEKPADAGLKRALLGN